ncbi:MAG TPA: alanine--tRNA ligase, partial [Clostridia bacterium]|nr:alanine--tRNA ligase [Clostridia bacterium]
MRTPDIEEVGRTARHHTFFEMLGNFSFGDYFKDEAILWAWEFVTEELGLSKDRLWISIYLDDDEAFEIWNKKIGIPEDRIVRLGKEDNFWEIGVGPCGPCSEIYFDQGVEMGCDSPDCTAGCECDRYLEIWNLVFIQYFKDEKGEYTPLKSKGIDTGMGLERVAAIMQGVYSNFDTDIFQEIMTFVEGLVPNAKPGADLDKQEDIAHKVIADHCRAVTFAISDGALPSNESRGYVIRRLLRRAVRFGRVLGIKEPFLHLVSTRIIEQMQDVYPELSENKDHVLRVIKNEEERFLDTLSQGTELLNGLIDKARGQGKTIVDGNNVFRLYDTYGFPVELTAEIVEEAGMSIDKDGFDKAMEEQRNRARKARKETKYLSEQDALFKVLRDELGETTFVGYDVLEAEAKVLSLLKDSQQEISALAGEEVEFVLNRTPCYAESGGQVSDHALLETDNGCKVEVNEVFKPVEDFYVHRGKVLEGELRLNDLVTVRVDRSRRESIMRNHSCTHLLHKALKEVLGGHVNQAGSLVDADRLRFDFTHYQLVDPNEIAEIEGKVNHAIFENLPVETVHTSLKEAKDMGAAALFDEKYGNKVRVVRMGDYSLELCGGTHVGSTSQIGLFKLTSEGSVGAGLRRIEGVTADGVLKHMVASEKQLEAIGDMVKAAPHELVNRVEGVLRTVKELEKEVITLKSKLARHEAQELTDRIKEVNGVKVLAARVEAPDMDSLRGMIDLLRDKMGSGVVLLASANGKKVSLVASVTPDLVKRGGHAGKLVKEIAQIVGG